MAMAMDSELSRRTQLWNIVSTEPVDELEPSRLRELGIYGGAQGIWVDKARTATVEVPEGVTVSILHTGRHYADDLSDDGVIYHYPKTNRSPSRDAGEVQATKNARNLQIPIFVVLPSKASASKRALKVGWVSDFDDDNRMFLILFSDKMDVAAPPQYVAAESATEPFKLEDDNRYRRQSTVLARKGQQRFRFHVLAKYGAQCAVCGISHPQLLKAAHIRGKADHGSDDWRNGIVLCATHHDAYDSFLFGIEPSTLALKVSPKVSAEEIGIQCGSLRLLKNRPH
jgi:putative restriction endonuclease